MSGFAYGISPPRDNSSARPGHGIRPAGHDEPEYIPEPPSNKSSESETDVIADGEAEVPRDTEAQYPDGHQESQLSKHDTGWRKIVKNFTPAWFSVNMGTGIVSIILFTLPYNGVWLYWISVGIMGLNIVIFIIIAAISILRYILYPETWNLLIQDSSESMFLGTMPPGLATIIAMIANVCAPSWGQWVAIVAWALWIIDSVLSTICACCLPFLLMLPRRKLDLSSMTASWLLPAISIIVAAATGGSVAGVLHNQQIALWTIIASYIMWGIGLGVTFMIMGIYFQRLAFHRNPPTSLIASVCLPIGPMGEGGFGILKLGQVARHTFKANQILGPVAGEVFYTAGFFTALLMWGFGLFWLFVAVASILKCRRFPFNMAWWGFVFPLGVFANCTIQLALEMPSSFFKVVSTIITICVVIFFLIVFAGTLRGAVTGKLFFHAPCLNNMRSRPNRSKTR